MTARSFDDLVDEPNTAFPLGTRSTAPFTPPDSLLFSSLPININTTHTSMPHFYSPDPALGLHLHDPHHQHPITAYPSFDHPSAPMPSRQDGRSSSTLGSSTLACTPTDELDLQYEYFSRPAGCGGGRSSAESIGDDFKGFFNDLHLDGLYPTTSSTQHTHDISPATMTPNSETVSPPSSHTYSSSAPAHSFLATHQGGPPTPFLFAGSDSPFQQPHLGPGWDSVNPFAADVEYDSSTASGPHPGSFALVKSNEDARTPQACQACRARKSKCDGLKNCSRCANRGIPCVYVVRSPRVRAPKRIPSAAERVPAAVSMSSCFSNEPLVHRPFSTPSSVAARAEVMRSRRRSSDTAIGLDRRGSIRRESEVRGLPSSSDPLGRRPSRKVDSAPPTTANDVFGWDGTHPAASSSSSASRRRSMADPSFGSPAELLTPPFGSSPWGVSGPFDHSPQQPSYSTSSYPNAPRPAYGGQQPSYMSHPPTFTPTHPAQSHRHSVAHPTPTSTGTIEHHLPSSPLSYFAPLPTHNNVPAPSPHHGEYYSTGGTPIVRPPPVSYEGLGYYPSSGPAIQPRRSSMPSFRPPPASASALFKSRGNHVEVLREEAEHVHSESRRASVLEPASGRGWEELSYAGRR